MFSYGGGAQTSNTSWTYDARGRVTEEVKTITGASSFTTAYTYSADDRVNTMTCPDGEVVTTTYNPMGLVATVCSNLDSNLYYVRATSYNARGQTTRQDYGNNSYPYTTWDYNDTTLRLTAFKTVGQVTALPYIVELQWLAYSYDNVGNVTALTDHWNSSESWTNVQYDHRDRLTQATRGGSTFTFSYNAIGNLTYKSDLGSYGYNGGKPHAVTSAGGNSYGYDANGNMTSRTIGGTGYSLSYYAENRLTQISGGASASLVYDADGQRVKRTQTGVTTVYVGNHYEKNTGTGAVTQYYYAGPQRVAMRQAGVVYTLVTDQLGSTSVSRNTSSGQVSGMRYYPWGTTRAGSVPTDYKFTGQRLDDATGLYYYGARYYDAALGRFVQADTIVPEPGNPQALNRFSYVCNNPLRYMDPTGHWTEEELRKFLGEDWYEVYFSDKGIFSDRPKLLEFLRSEKTTDLVTLGVVSGMLTAARGASAVGFSFKDTDAIGARIAGSGGAILLGGGSVDALLNLTAGEFSVFLSAEGGAIFGESVTGVGGLQVVKNLPSNDLYRGGFEAVGLVVGYGPSASGEFFWGAPLTDKFHPLEKPFGAFIGGGPGEALGLYGNVSYSFEALRVDKNGTALWPDPHRSLADVPSIVGDIGRILVHDVLLHPIWPWSPYR